MPELRHPETDTSRTIVSTPAFAVPLRSFAQAIKVRATGDLLFLSGITARGPDGTIIGVGDVERQARAIFENMRALLAAAGGSLADVVKTTTFVRSASDIPKVGRVRMEYWDGSPPASTSVEVSGLADPQQLVEIEAIAVIARGR